MALQVSVITDSATRSSRTAMVTVDPAIDAVRWASVGSAVGMVGVAVVDGDACGGGVLQLARSNAVLVTARRVNELRRPMRHPFGRGVDRLAER